MDQTGIRAVFFDIDNTLLSFTGYVRETMRKGFEKFGLPPYTEDMYQVFERENDRLWRLIEQGSLSFGRLKQIRWNNIFRELGIDFDGPAFERYFRDQLYESAIPEPGAVEILDYLKGRYLLIAASNGPYGQQVHRLKTGGMYGYFSHVFISEKVGAQKPSREFFDYCFRVLREHELPDIRPEETVMIGDSMTSDIAGGAACSMHTILYLRGKAQNTPLYRDTANVQKRLAAGPVQEASAKARQADGTAQGAGAQKRLTEDTQRAGTGRGLSPDLCVRTLADIRGIL